MSIFIYGQHTPRQRQVPVEPTSPESRSGRSCSEPLWNREARTGYRPEGLEYSFLGPYLKVQGT